MAPSDPAEIHESVRAHYAAVAATLASGSGCCGPAADAPCCRSDADPSPYGEAARGLPPTAASLGCGNPTAVADLGPGAAVLDLGSGAGLDVLVSARRVGPTGRVVGLDGTEAMVELATANARRAGVENVEFVHGSIEAIPLPDASVDVVLSNCVINLAADKGAVFRESFRVLRPGGRFAVTDIVAEDRLGPAERAARGSLVGCIAGALSAGEFRSGLLAAGFTDVALAPTHQVADGLHATIVQAVKPG